MTTRIDRFVSQLQDVGRLANDLATSGYQDNQLRDLVTNIGGRTELFLKTVVLPRVSARATFSECINELGQAGVADRECGTLHRLRKIYNDCKHDPAYSPSLLELQTLLPEVVSVACLLGARNLGNTNQPEKLTHKRMLWIAAWDHYIGGDCEVHLIVPTTDGWPPTLDLVYIQMMAWGQVKILLSASGTIRPGKEAIPSPYYDELAGEGDFREAIVYQGEYSSPCQKP